MASVERSDKWQTPRRRAARIADIHRPAATLRAPTMASQTKTITKGELEKHNDEKDCWLAIGGKVYDVTKFLDNHPGGPEIVYEHAGAPACRRRLWGACTR